MLMGRDSLRTCKNIYKGFPSARTPRPKPHPREERHCIARSLPITEKELASIHLAGKTHFRRYCQFEFSAPADTVGLDARMLHTSQSGSRRESRHRVIRSRLAASPRHRNRIRLIDSEQWPHISIPRRAVSLAHFTLCCGPERKLRVGTRSSRNLLFHGD